MLPSEFVIAGCICRDKSSSPQKSSADASNFSPADFRWLPMAKNLHALMASSTNKPRTGSAGSL